MAAGPGTLPPPELDLLALVRAVSAGPQSPLPALAATWADPEGFYRALIQLRRRGPVPLKSALDQGVDLYHDLVAPHLGQGRDALLVPTAGLGWRRLSFDDAHVLSARLAASWEEAGVEAGECVAIVLPVGPEYLVAVLTALRLGLLLSPLPPRGPAFVQHRLKALAPAHVATHARYEALLGDGGGGHHLLPVTPREGGPAVLPLRSHTYAPEAPVVRLFSPFAADPLLPLERTATTVLRGMLRDGIVTLGLGPQDRVATPGFEPLQHQPALLFATLFSGACWLELDEADLLDRELLAQAAPRVLGVTAKGRDALLERAELPPLRLWLRNPAEPFDWDRWSRFARHLAEVRPCRGLNFLASAAHGGSLLFSAHQPDPQLSVLPAPGEPWQLADLNQSGEPAAGPSGLYATVGDDAAPEAHGQFLVARTASGFFFSGSIALLARGQVYATTEVESLAELHPLVRAAIAVTTPHGATLNGTHVTLVLFADPLRATPEGSGALAREVAELVVRELGARAAPDLVRVVPLAPRKDAEGSVDRAWARWQYLGGGLGRKARDGLFLSTSRLRALGQAVLAAPASRAQEDA